MGTDLLELARILAVLPRVEAGRRFFGPNAVIPGLRARGRLRLARETAQRGRLRRLIGLVDRCMPGGGNCYRRVLMEIALDAAAAHEPIHMGLREHGGPGSGHAWLASERSAAAGERYEAEFVT